MGCVSRAACVGACTAHFTRSDTGGPVTSGPTQYFASPTVSSYRRQGRSVSAAGRIRVRRKSGPKSPRPCPGRRGFLFRKVLRLRRLEGCKAEARRTGGKQAQIFTKGRRDVDLRHEVQAGGRRGGGGDRGSGSFPASARAPAVGYSGLRKDSTRNRPQAFRRRLGPRA